ncbi:MAG: hypothetical protein K1060chlam4_00581 [Candidatus Anoxychlamydiales bacterium]|nr:hypothetical protein [Candidatus Anoxychlamydiales bacterium]
MRKFHKKYLPIFFLWILFSSFNGFEYRNIKTFDPLSIHIIEIDPSKYEILPSLANDNKISRATVLDIAKRKKAKAAINGCFFKIDGRPAGILKIDNKWISLPEKQRAALGWNRSNTIFMIDRLDAKASIFFQNLEFSIDGINRPRETNERILYLSPFYSTYKIDPNNLSCQVLSKNFFLAFREADEISTFVKYNDFDYKIDVFPKVSPSDSHLWEDLDHIIGGTPLLIYNREKIYDYSSEKTLQKFITNKYARTAIGITENGNLLFVVVDGNDYKNSIGLTIDELRDLMYDLGSIYALNLDGGGSSTMVIDDKLVNSPEDGYLEKVSNAILILKK